MDKAIETRLRIVVADHPDGKYKLIRVYGEPNKDGNYPAAEKMVPVDASQELIDEFTIPAIMTVLQMQREAE